MIKYSIFLENQVAHVFFSSPIKMGEGWAEGLGGTSPSFSRQDAPTPPSTVHHQFGLALWGTA